MEFTASFQSLSACIWMAQTAKYSENVNFPDPSRPAQPASSFMTFFQPHISVEKNVMLANTDFAVFPNCWNLKDQKLQNPRNLPIQGRGLAIADCRSLWIPVVALDPVILNHCLQSNYPYETISLIFKKLNIWKIQNMIEPTVSPVSHTS